MIDTDNGPDVGFVPGDGPPNAQLFLVGEAPAKNEIRIGRPFVGQAGQFLDSICTRAKLPPREMMYITNVIKVPAINNEDEHITELQISEWEWMLHAELEEHRPRVVASLGSWSTRWFLRNYSRGYPNTNDLDWLHGIPRVGTAPWGTFLLVPCFHPAAGLHDGDSIPKIFSDLESLRDVYNGHLIPLTDTIKRCYKWCDSVDHFPPTDTLYIAVDTEGYPGSVDLISYSYQKGEGWVIKDKDLMSRFVMWLMEYRGSVIFHNAPWDLGVLASMGLSTTDLLFNVLCTMQLAKYLNVESLGLKTLAWRLMGVEMNEYADIVRPVQQELTREYIKMLSTIPYPKPDGHIEWKNGIAKVKKGWGLSQYIKRIITDLDKDPMLDVVMRWGNIPESTRKTGTDIWGQMPVATLDQVDPVIARDYSGQDADVTLCLYSVLNNRLRCVYGVNTIKNN